LLRDRSDFPKGKSRVPSLRQWLTNENLSSFLTADAEETLKLSATKQRGSCGGRGGRTIVIADPSLSRSSSRFLPHNLAGAIAMQTARVFIALVSGARYKVSAIRRRVRARLAWTAMTRNPRVPRNDRSLVNHGRSSGRQWRRSDGIIRWRKRAARNRSCNFPLSVPCSPANCNCDQ